MDSDLEAELVFNEDAASDALREAEKTAVIDTDLPDDCALGDGGAYALVGSSDRPEAEPVQPLQKRKREILRIQSTHSFASILSTADRIFNVGNEGCVVQIEAGVSVDSKKTVATVFSDSTLVTRLGYISSAEPLGTTNGLKATCCQHREKKLSPCVCWIAYPKSKDVSPEDRLDLFKSLCEWLSEGKSENREEHSVNSYNLRVAAGMKPRTLKK